MIMSTQSLEDYSSYAGTAADGPTNVPLFRRWLKAIERIRGGIRRRRQLMGLVALNDRLLADIGITREQVDAARKAYWI
jgi:uncharacterized protein YjiS (DUF1127 family)